MNWQCPSCLSSIEINESQHIHFCPYCGEKIELLPMESSTTESCAIFNGNNDQTPVEDTLKVCPVCCTEIEKYDSGSLTLCQDCKMTYHKDCWIDNKGCATYGCPSAGSLNPPIEKIEIPIDSNQSDTICTQCSTHHAPGITICWFCGHELKNVKTDNELMETNVLLMIFLTVITVGIYRAIWFLRRRDAINSLQSKEKLNTGVFVFIIVLYSISVLVNLADGNSSLLYLIAGITLLVQCFKVRRIFNEHFNTYLKKDISFSGVATFFFTIFYLQYKINRF